MTALGEHQLAPLLGEHQPASLFAKEPEPFEWNGLVLGEQYPFGLEEPSMYMPGGHHPVHLGDSIGSDGRYRVMHKLGHGGFGIVWMCRDLQSDIPKYVAVKIIVAEISEDDCPELRLLNSEKFHPEWSPGMRHVCLPLSSFRINGPSGTHLCFVYPILAPICSILKATSDDGAALRKVAFQTTQAMAALHEIGICHGDFRPSNIMLRMTGLDGTSEDELLKIIGEPARAPLTTTTGKKHACPSAPQYLVRPVRFHLLSNLHYITDQACLIDFGQSYEASHPPDDLGIPTPYQSPEFVLERAVGQPSDIWALGNTLFEIRTGQKLFRPFDDDPDQYLSGMVKILGKLPERWWRKIWRNRSAFFLDDPDDQGNPVETHPVKLNGSRPRSLRTKIAAFGMEYEMSPVGCPGAPDICDKIPETEIAVFADLLSKLLRYEPHERISAREALDHEWFRIDGTKHDMMQGVSDEAIYLEDFISAARQSMRSEQSASITHGFVGGGRERKDIPPELC